MQRKVLQIQVEIDIQSVTCPGVWLCPSGKVSLQVYLLDSFIQTTALPPEFPLLYHEKFVFYKSFNRAHSLSDLQRLINKEFLYAELIQWKDCDNGNVLATFQACLTEVLYPTSYDGAAAGVDIDLLMEPSKNFPGIIAPKIEISCRTTIEEIICAYNQKKNSAYAVNPKTIASDVPRSKRNIHQRKVCHSLGYHKSTRCGYKQNRKPQFAFRKAEDNLLARKPQGLESGSTGKCRCGISSQSFSNMLAAKKADFPAMPTPSDKTYSKLTEEFLQQYPKPVRGRTKRRTKQGGGHCRCKGDSHSQDSCLVCCQYKTYFEGSKPCSCTSATELPSKQQLAKGDYITSYVKKVSSGESLSRDQNRQSSRSPVRTGGKDRHLDKEHQAVPCKVSPCDCSPPKRIQGPIIACDCSVSSDNKSSRCLYSSRTRKPSLAEQLHRRLKQTLDCTTYPFTDLQRGESSDGDSQDCCPCSRSQDCRRGFCKNLEKFYNDLRRC